MTPESRAKIDAMTDEIIAQCGGDPYAYPDMIADLCTRIAAIAGLWHSGITDGLRAPERSLERWEVRIGGNGSGVPWQFRTRKEARGYLQTVLCSETRAFARVVHVVTLAPRRQQWAVEWTQGGTVERAPHKNRGNAVAYRDALRANGHTDAKLVRVPR